MKIVGLVVAALVCGCVFQDNVGDSDDDAVPVPPGPRITPRWAISFGGGWDDHAVAVAIDPAGDVIIGGTFSHETDFGAGLVTSPQPPSCCGDASETIYNTTGFVTKRSGSDGSDLWTVILDGAVDADISAVATDAAGNVYVTGRINDFGGSDTRSAELRMATIALDPDGSERWRSELPSSSLSWASAIAVSPQGTTYVLGTMSGVIDLGGGPIKAIHPTRADTLLLAYAPDGTMAWGRDFPAGDAGFTDIVVTADGGLVLSGETASAYALGGFDLTALDRTDSLLARLSAEGDVSWARVVRPTEYDAIGRGKLGTTPTGQIAITANEFKSSADPQGNHVATLMFDPAGELLASNLVKGAYASRPVLDPDGDFLVGGNINGFSADFGNGASRGRFYIAAYDDAATPQGAISYAPPVQGGAWGSFDAVDATTNGLAVAGFFVGPLDLGSGPFTFAGGRGDVVVAMYDWVQP